MKLYNQDRINPLVPCCGHVAATLKSCTELPPIDVESSQNTPKKWTLIFYTVLFTPFPLLYSRIFWHTLSKNLLSIKVSKCNCVITNLGTFFKFGLFSPQNRGCTYTLVPSHPWFPRPPKQIIGVYVFIMYCRKVKSEFTISLT